MAAYNLIATTTVGSGGAASIDFTSIPATYTDLLVVVSHRVDRANTISDSKIQFNADTASNYVSLRLYGDGSAATSDQLSTTAGYWGYSPGATATASVFSNTQIYIPNYAGSTQKSVSVDSVQENNTSAAYSHINAIRWTGTAAITSIKLFDGNATNFVQYSSASLYGIKNS
jgi:hypothetical protein